MTAKMILQISLGESVSRLGQRCQEFAMSVLETYLAVKGILTVFVGCRYDCLVMWLIRSRNSDLEKIAGSR